MQTSVPFATASNAALTAALILLPVCAQAQPSETLDPSEVERAGDSLRELLGSVWTPQAFLTDSAKTRAAFRGVVSDARRATVRVRVKGKNRSLGGVVGPDGWVLTKASRLNGPNGGGPVTVKLGDDREFDARVVGVDRDYDLAMLKVDAKDLPTLDLSHTDPPSAGDWVATVGQARDPVAIGVVSVQPRKIAHRPGLIGVSLGESVPGIPGVVVVKVIPKGGAEKAGILVNDVITNINGEPVRSRANLQRKVFRHSPGDVLEVTVSRNGQPLTMRVTLTGHGLALPRMSRSEYQNSLGGSLSQRRFGFPSALQHDTKLQASECGGPLVDLDGRVVGFNLARSGRTESYAVPLSELPQRLFELMSGSRSPGDEEAEAE